MTPSLSRQSGSLALLLCAIIIAHAASACGGASTTEGDEPGLAGGESESAGETSSTVSPATSTGTGGEQGTDQPDAQPTITVPADASADILEDALRDAVERARDGDLGSARLDLQQLISEEEVRARAAYALGVIAFYDGQESQARDYFETAMEADPSLGEPLVASIRLDLRDGDVAGARSTLNRQLSRSENAPAVRAAGLYLDLYSGAYESVIDGARAVLLDDEANLDAHYTMAIANLRLGRLELAEYYPQRRLGPRRQSA